MKIIRFLTSIVILFFLIAITAGCKDNRSFTIDSLDIQASILPNGELLVEELYTYHFQGKFKGTTRTIVENGGKEVTAFEAFLPKSEKSLGSYQNKDLQKLKVEKENHEYRIFTASENESKQILYRYKLKNALAIHKDTAELYWTYFAKNNKTDIHHLSIDIVFPESKKESDEIQYFLHDQTNSAFTEITDTHLQYENELLPAKTLSEIRMLFPTSWVPDAKITNETNRKADIIAQETKLEERYAARDEKRKQIIPWFMASTVMLLLTILYFAFFTPARIARRQGRQISFKELEQLDPLFVAYLYRQTHLQWKDISASLFSLYQRKIVDIKRIPAGSKYKSDPNFPNETFIFILNGNTSELPDHERFLIDWLFIEEKNNIRTFTLESLAGPAESEKNNKQLLEMYQNKMTKFDEAFKEWAYLVATNKTYSSLYHPLKSFKYLTRFLVILLFAFTMHLYIVEVVSTLKTALAGITLGFTGIAVFIFNKSSWSILIYLSVVLSAIMIAVPSSEAFYWLLMITLLAFLLFIVLPSKEVSVSGAPYVSAIKHWRRTLKKDFYPAGTDPVRLERLIQYAIILEVSEPFVQKHGDLALHQDAAAILPLIAFPNITSSSFTNTYHSIDIPSSTTDGHNGGGGAGGGGSAGAF